MRKYSDKWLNKYFGNLENHQYKHFSRAFDCWVEGKEHYIYLLRKTGSVPYEVGCRLVEEADKNRRKDYKISSKALSFIRYVQSLTKDSEGNIQLGGRAILRMKELGVNFNRAEVDLQIAKGGFN